MLAIQKLFIDYNYSIRNTAIKYIILHDVGASSSAKNNRDYLASGNKNASADFFTDSNNIIQTMDYHTRNSWAVGDGHGSRGITNSNSVSVEMCLEFNMKPSTKTIGNTVDLIKYLMKELNIPIENVKRHYDASFKRCPGSFSDNNWSQWYDFKNKLTTNNIIVTSPPKPNSKVNYVLEFQRFYNLSTQSKNQLVCDGTYGNNTQTALDTFLGYVKQSKKYKYCKDFQCWFNFVTQTGSPLSEDGIYGNKTEIAFQLINKICKK